MDLASDLLDKYTTEQVIAYMDKLASGVLQSYQIAIKANQPQVLFSCTGDLTQIHSILREMKKRNDAREAAKRQV